MDGVGLNLFVNGGLVCIVFSSLSPVHVIHERFVFFFSSPLLGCFFFRRLFYTNLRSGVTLSLRSLDDGTRHYDH